MSTTETTPAFQFKRLPIGDSGQLIKTSALLKSPRSLIIISAPKSGKTDQMMDVPKFYIGDCEDGTVSFEGNNYTDLKRYESDSPFYATKSGAFIPAGLYETCTELNKANNMKKFNMLYEQLKLTKSPKVYEEIVALINDMPFPIFSIDTLTSFMKLIYESALAEYNSALDQSKWKADIKRADQYGGAQYIRRALEDVKSFIERNAAPFIIYNGHIKMKKSVLKKSDEEISTVDIALEGVLPTIFSSSASAVSVFYRDDKGCFLDFRKREDSDVDARPRHLGNRLIKIAELHEYGVNEEGETILLKKGKTYWERIYPEINFSA
jgi:hypothetical protein